MNENLTRRCALIFHCKDSRGNIYILLGCLSGELTSIGGRKDRSESDLDCCCREVFEETKELVDFYPYKHGLNCGLTYMYSACAYYIIEERYEILGDLCERFKETNSDKKEQNELSELILYEIDNLAEILILNRVAYKDEFKEFFLTILYRLLKPTINRGILTIDISEEAELFVLIKSLPTTLDIIPNNSITSLENKPKIYGKLLKRDYLLVECFYDCGLFRSGTR